MRFRGRDIRAVLLDLDETVYEAAVLLPGPLNAIQAVRRGRSPWWATTSSTRSGSCPPFLPRCLDSRLGLHNYFMTVISTPEPAIRL